MMNTLARLRTWISRHPVAVLGIGLFCGATIIILGGYSWTRYIGTSNIIDWTLADFVQEMFSNLGTELLSIAITLLVVNRLINRGQRGTQKRQLIRQLGSKANDFSLFAAAELRYYGWLFDGTLKEANLYKANLTNANLRGADLTNADLREVDPTDANLWEAKLAKADLTDARYNNTTTWPEGFDPKAAGAINVDEQEAEPGS